MNISRWLDLVNFGLVVLIWLVQVIIYPSFAHISRAEFVTWHKKYIKIISSVVSPLMLIQLAMILRLVLTRPNLPHYFMLSAVIIIWISSFTLSVPCHRKLQRTGWNLKMIGRLVRTNWIRTILWTVVFLTGIVF